jgi:Protein of unknown function (DUF3592)
VLLLLAAFAAAALAYALEERHVLFTNGAVATQGTVVALADSRTDRDEPPIYHAVIEFHDREGRAHRFRSRSGGTGTRWRIGDRHDVLYRPERPQRAELKHEMPAFYGALAIFAVLAFGAAAWLFTRPRAAAGTASRTD